MVTISSDVSAKSHTTKFSRIRSTRFYLRNFADSSEKLNAFRQGPNGGSYSLSTPDNLCAENYLYEAGRRGFAYNPEHCTTSSKTVWLLLRDASLLHISWQSIAVKTGLFKERCFLPEGTPSVCSPPTCSFGTRSYLEASVPRLTQSLKRCLLKAHHGARAADTLAGRSRQ